MRLSTVEAPPPAPRAPAAPPGRRPPRLRAALPPTLPLPSSDPKAAAAREHSASGVPHVLAGRGEDALKDFDLVCRSLSKVPDGWHNRGVVLAMLGRPAEALPAFDAAIRLEDEDADTWDGREAFLPEPARSKCMAREYATACDAADLPR